MISRTLGYLPAVLVGIVMAAPSAEAALMMRIDDLSTAGIDVEISDTNGDGLLAYAGSVGTWTSFSGGVGTQVMGTPDFDAMDLFSLDISGSAGTLVVSLTDTDFMRTSSQFTAGVGGTTMGSVSVATYLSTSNTAFDTSMLLSSLGDFTAGELPPGGGFADGDSQQIDVDSPYAITMVATITHSGAGQVSSLDYNIKIPEPGPLALLGIGLVALVTSRRLSRGS